MDKYLKKQLYVWVYDKLKANPKVFGGDFSNSLIMYEYLIDFYQDRMVSELKPEQMSILSTVSRIKNKLLLQNPQFDNRTKYVAKTNAVGDNS